MKDNIPIDRLKGHYSEIAATSTLDYIAYCVTRIFPHGQVTLYCRGRVSKNALSCGIMMPIETDAYIVRFRVPIDAGGVGIKAICQNAGDHLARMIGEAGHKTKSDTK